MWIYSFVSETALGQNVTRVELLFYTAEPRALPCTDKNIPLAVNHNAAARNLASRPRFHVS